MSRTIRRSEQNKEDDPFSKKAIEDEIFRIQNRLGNRNRVDRENLTEIQDHYFKIRDQSRTVEAKNEIHRFDLVKMLRKSAFTRRVLPYSSKQFQRCIFQLSRDWDEWVNRNRKEGEKGTHRFFLTFDHDTGGRPYIARFFNCFDDADMRLVAIIAPNQWFHRFYMDYMPLIHEMGHFIGGRYRKERKEMLAHITLIFYLREVYNLCHHEILGTEPGTAGQLFTRSPYGNDLNQVRNNSLLKWFKNIYLILRRSLKEYIQRSDETIHKHISDDFSHSFISGVIKCVQNYTASNEFWDYYLHRWKPDNSHDREIVQLIRESCKKTNESMTNTGNRVIDDIQDYIEEPLADCFMIVIGGLNVQDYLRLILKQSWEYMVFMNGGEENPKSYLDYICNDITRIRILAILYAMNAKKKDIYRRRDRLTAVLARRQGIHLARHLLANEYETMCAELEKYYADQGRKDASKDYMRFEPDFLDLSIPIALYIRDIYNTHPHYREIRERKVSETIRNIRFFKLKFTPLIFLRQKTHSVIRHIGLTLMNTAKDEQK